MERNFVIHLKHKEKAFNEGAVRRNIVPDFLDCKESMADIRRIIMTEVVDLYQPNPIEAVKLYSRYVVPFYISDYFEPEFVDDLDSKTNPLRTFIIWSAVDFTEKLKYILRSDVINTVGYLDSMNYDVVKVRVETMPAGTLDEIYSRSELMSNNFINQENL